MVLSYSAELVSVGREVATAGKWLIPAVSMTTSRVSAWPGQRITGIILVWISICLSNVVKGFLTAVASDGIEPSRAIIRWQPCSAMPFVEMISSDRCRGDASSVTSRSGDMYVSSDPVETGSYEFRVPAISGVPIGSKYRAVLHACWENVML